MSFQRELRFQDAAEASSLSKLSFLDGSAGTVAEASSLRIRMEGMRLPGRYPKFTVFC